MNQEQIEEISFEEATHRGRILCDKAESGQLPAPAMEIVETKCYQCGFVTRLAVKPEFIDWEQVANEYKETAEGIQKKVNDMINDISLMHSDNPILEYINNEWAIMLESIGKRFDQ